MSAWHQHRIDVTPAANFANVVCFFDTLLRVGRRNRWFLHHVLDEIFEASGVAGTKAQVPLTVTLWTPQISTTTV